jgi:glycine hydroxymethyltransferase
MSTIEKGLTGSKVEHAFDEFHITLNKNTIVGDKSAMTPGGIRMGTPAVTSRGYFEEDIKEVARFIDEGIQVCLSIQNSSGKKLVDFKKGVSQSKEIADLG